MLVQDLDLIEFLGQLNERYAAALIVR